MSYDKCDNKHCLNIASIEVKSLEITICDECWGILFPSEKNKLKVAKPKA